jgi:hypothetical protein
MSRYYFDIHDGQQLMRDHTGTELSGPQAIRVEAMYALPTIARDAIPRDGDRQVFTVLVRNESNLVVYTATLSYSGLWLGEEPPPPPGKSDNDGRTAFLVD